MANLARMYMTVSVDRVPGGLNLAAAFSPDDIPSWERIYYPHTYTREEGLCSWVIRSSGELSIKFCAMLTETGERSCAHALATNAKRNVGGR